MKAALVLLQEMVAGKCAPTTASIEPLLLYHVRNRDIEGALAFLDTIASVDPDVPSNVMLFTKALQHCLTV